MDPQRPAGSPEQKNFLLGLGLDGKDGHRRVTRGEGFHLEGGSEETHARLQEVVIKVDETLRRKGQDIPRARPEELRDLVEEQLDSCRTPSPRDRDDEPR